VIRYLLDTNVVSEPAKKDPYVAVLSRLRERGGQVALPSVAWQELIYGARRMDEGRRRDYLLDYLQEVIRPSMPIVPYDAAAARWHGWARAHLERRGHPTAFADGQIAGIAATEELTLVTRNTADFEHFATLAREAAEGERFRVENRFDA